MNSSSKTNQLGFTLIEILLYLTLSSIMVALIGGIGVNVLSGLTNAKAEEDLQYNAQFVTEKVRTYILSADSIGFPEVGAASSSLHLVMSDSSKNPTKIFEQNGMVFVQEGENAPAQFSGDNIVVSGMEFFNMTKADGAGMLRILVPMSIYNPDGKHSLRASSTLKTTLNLKYP